MALISDHSTQGPKRWFSQFWKCFDGCQVRVNHLQVLKVKKNAFLSGMLTSFYLPTSYLNSPSLRISPKCAYELLLRVAKHDGAASQGGGLPNFQVNVFQAWKKTKYICQNNPAIVLSYFKIVTNVRLLIFWMAIWYKQGILKISEFTIQFNAKYAFFFSNF